MKIPHITTEQSTALGWSDFDLTCINISIDYVNEKAKPRTVVNGESMTVEAAQKLFEETEDTHDWEWSSTQTRLFQACTNPSFSHKNTFNVYRYKPKQPKLKLIDWAKVPVGVMTDKGEFRGTYTDSDGKPVADVETSAVLDYGIAQRTFFQKDLRLAPVFEQRWVAVQDIHEPLYDGLAYKKQYNNMLKTIAFKVTGIAPGYTDNPELDSNSVEFDGIKTINPELAGGGV